MRKITLLLGLIILLFFGCGKFNTDQEILDKINEISKLRVLERKTNANDSTLIYIEEIQKIINGDLKLPDTLLIENLFRKGYYYKQIKELDSAAHYFHKTINLVKAPNNRKRNYVYFRNAWETEENRNKFANAISIGQKFIDISNRKDHLKELVYAYNFLERINISLRDYKQSLYYNSKALEAAKESSNINMYVITASSKARTLYYYLNKKEEAYKLLDSLSTIESNGEPKRQLHREYGIIQFYDGNYKEALKNYKTALKITKERKSSSRYNYNLLEAYNNISEAYIEIEDYDLAKKYLDSTKAIIKPNSDPDYVLFYNELLFIHNYRTINSEKKALSAYKSLVDKNRSFHEKKVKEELVALKLANEKEKIITKEKNETELRNYRLLALLGLAVLLLLIGYLFYRQRRFKFEKQDMQMQQRLLASQMNPHFTFNTLSVIQNQIEKNKEGAVNYLLKFSRLLRLILENSLNDYVQIENELESLRKYIDLQLLRFPNKFSYNIVLENFEEEDFLFIPPMLIQPFVENSIEHGFLGINYKGKIDIKLELQNKYIACAIEDNGMGIKKSNNNYKKSVSTKLISTFINKTTKSNVVILDKKNNEPTSSGVLVKFLIPYKFSEND
ncbi:histidine kinase [uncultured Lacinutrix sp.]|uniref:tetratricopeptide repeat-containing sensor histidine kinase n=1 Tax=uncultured Lacinutrix sp. TaxID=574032 RepID=UPI00262E8DD2|nr:histidine kinase [uncultured Lacinutrix sp.]